MRKMIVLVLVCCFVALPLRAAGWFCKEAASEKSGSLLRTCGVWESGNEAEARAKARNEAFKELDAMCSKSPDCNRFEVIIQPLRNDCTPKNNDGLYRCYRGVEATITSIPRNLEIERKFADVDEHEIKIPIKKSIVQDDAIDLKRGILSFVSSPDSSQVVLNGVSACFTPCSRELQYGEHQVAIKHEGYASFEKSIKVSSATDTISVALASVYGVLKLEGVPLASTIKVDDVLQEQNRERIHLNKGKHVVVIDNPNFQQFVREVDIIDGETSVVMYSPAPLFAYVNLRVRDEKANDLAAIIYINGKKENRPTPIQVKIPAGTNEIRFEINNKVHSESVVVAANEAKEVVWEMKDAYYSVSYDSNGNGACALFNGEVKCWEDLADNGRLQVYTYMETSSLISRQLNSPQMLKVSGGDLCVLDRNKLVCRMGRFDMSFPNEGVKTISNLRNPKNFSYIPFALRCVADAEGAQCWNERDERILLPIFFNKAEKIFLAGPHICGLANGKVRCWEFDSVKDGDSERYEFDEIPVKIQFTTKVEDMVFGKSAFCVSSSKQLQCYSSKRLESYSKRIPHDYYRLKLPQYKKLVRLLDDECAVFEDGVKCWGSVKYVPQGIGEIQAKEGGCFVGDKGVACTNEGLFMDPWRNIIESRIVVAGNYFDCFWDSRGFVCPGHKKLAPPFKKLDSIVAKDIACAVLDGQLHCWGDELSHDSRANRILKTQPRLTNVKEVSISETHICVIDVVGVKCWGGDHEIVDVPPLNNPQHVAVGKNFSCAIDATGIVCWGRGDFHISKMSAPTQIFAAGRDFCALDSTGLVCQNVDSSHYSLVPPESVKHPERVGISDEFACALENKKVICWDRNLKFSDVTRISPWLQEIAKKTVGSSIKYSCYLKEEKWKCTLGDAIAGGNSQPVYFIEAGKVKLWHTRQTNGTVTPLVDLTNATDLSVSSTHACALDSGKPICWGASVPKETKAFLAN